jgi:hypothetical protein
MKKIYYLLDEQLVEIKNENIFKYGEDKILSTSKTDICFFQPWYTEGFVITPLLNKKEHSAIKISAENKVYEIIKSMKRSNEKFTLENYHNFVKKEIDHFNIVKITRDLFPEDFSFSTEKLISRIGKMVNLNLTDIDPETNERTHIILRINRPQSEDFNPPHKDIYEAYDQEKRLPKMINVWIPICGVTSLSSLALAPKSHLLPENKIQRSFIGGKINKKEFRVRNILSWDGEKKLTRIYVHTGSALLFTPHLIHGLAVNNQENITRVSLEYRLYKKN